MAAAGKRLAPIEHAHIIEAEKTAFENIVAFSVFAIHPPGEIQHQFVEDSYEKFPIANTASLLLDRINAPGRPRMHRWIDIPKCPLIRGQLTVRMHVPFA